MASCLCRVFAVLLPCICNVFCREAAVLRVLAAGLLCTGSSTAHAKLVCECVWVVLCDGRALAMRLLCAFQTVLSAMYLERATCCHVGGLSVMGRPGPICSGQALKANVSDAAKPRPEPTPCGVARDSLVQTHLQVALRGDLENFTALAWQYAELFAVLEHHMEPRFVGAQDQSKRKGAHATLIESAEAWVTVHIAPPLQHVATRGQVNTELPSRARGRLTMP